MRMGIVSYQAIGIFFGGEAIAYLMNGNILITTHSSMQEVKEKITYIKHLEDSPHHHT
jgi:hypothetical protein